MKLRSKSFPCAALVLVPEIPLDTCLTHLLGHVYKAGSDATLASIDNALSTLRQKVAERLVKPKDQSS
jgi:hypothetical protein